MGYIAYSRQVTLGLLSAVTGTLLLAMAASALNEVQESHIDAQMERTRNRPLPSGVVSARAATGLALILAGLGAVDYRGGAEPQRKTQRAQRIL